jgi:hypothetical protein
MPNHITNYVEIKGDAGKLAELVGKTLRTTDEGVEFDFNGIVQMPVELRETDSPTSVVATQEEADEKNKEYCESGNVHGGTVRYISQVESDRRAKLYGRDNGNRFTPQPVLNWYDWARINWGTKWGAYDVSIIHQSATKLVLQFDTAWSTPEPIFERLVGEGFEVNCFWEDEGGPEGEYGHPYDVFDIEHPSTIVEYIGGEAA